MANFKEQMETDLENVFFNANEFAVEATFTPSGGSSGTVVNVILDHNALVQMDGYETGVTTLGTVIEARYSDVGKPKSGGTFLIDGTTYTVSGVPEISEDKAVTRIRVV